MRNGNVQQEMHIKHAALQDSIPIEISTFNFLKKNKQTKQNKKQIAPDANTQDKILEKLPTTKI